MSGTLRRLTKLHHYHYPVVGVVGLVYTVAFHGPGTHQLSIGPVEFDAFYAAVIGFGALIVFSLTDGYYDAAEYGIDESEE
ncbi:hypothetical protein SAMN06269185_1403 [Natronoarchaeum philippinense]|uniref:Uncharacterized protein n=1 Tax=Natronoarchaeum philippinense TaxID=558529 RepID=A0A285NQP4_NATPI|nr:hypothetical protein [Natronoarchaeum philippinense]SNZ11822.1 hypothetical protein SAMN06269185_1403 [Natronoarchaeum philippinense]